MLIKTNGVVKWFSQVKGYGFIIARGLDSDVFVHVSALLPDQELLKGSKVEFLMQKFSTGYRAQEILRLDNSEAERDTVSRKVDTTGPESDWIIGYMKWFNLRRGFGFITVPRLDADALLHITVVNRCGVQTIPRCGRPVLIKYRSNNGRFVVSTLSVEEAKSNGKVGVKPVTYGAPSRNSDAIPA